MSRIVSFPDGFTSATVPTIEDDIIYEGYSERFGEDVSLSGLKNTLDYIINAIYIPPLITSFTGGYSYIFEKGENVNTVVLSLEVAKRSSDISRITFLKEATIISDENPPSITGSGVTSSVSNSPFSDTTTFYVEVTDSVYKDSGPTVVIAELTYTFIFPYYKGTGASNLTPTQIVLLPKLIIEETSETTQSFTAENGDVYYFAYLASYGDLTSILDENGFEVFDSFTKRTEYVFTRNGTVQIYKIYEFNNPVVAGTTSFTFKQ